jgi:transposase
LGWAGGFGVLHRAGVEGTGSYGVALTRCLRRHQVTVIKVNRRCCVARPVGMLMPCRTWCQIAWRVR